MIPLSQVPRHARQKDYEDTFGLGAKELVLKTYSATLARDGDVFGTTGKLWISLNYVCFSAGTWRVAIPFTDVKEFKSAGWRTIDVVTLAGQTRQLSGLWHKDAALALLGDLWFHNTGRALPARKSSVSAASSPTGAAALAPAHMDHQWLDELDEVADLLLLLPESPAPAQPGPPSQSSTATGPATDGAGRDAYGFLPEDAAVYAEFVPAYAIEQSRMHRRWIKFLRKRADGDLLANRDELLALLKRGVPPELRPSVYFRVSGARRKRNEVEPGYYTRLRDEARRRAMDTEWGRAVDKDVLRTFPYHRDFCEGADGVAAGALLEPLRAILWAYGLRNASVGYCQGMNFVCGALLLLFRGVHSEAERDEKVFWVMCAIVEDLLPAYYCGDMIGSMVDQSVLAHYCEKLLPKLYAQFKLLEYPISLVLVKWMNCLFWLNTPAETAARVMDVALLLGSDALLEVSLSFLAAFQTRLCQCHDLHEISTLLDSALLRFYPTPANVERMQLCLGQLDRRELTTMRHRVYEKAESRLRDYSTARTLDRLRHLGSLDEAELRTLHAHWAEMAARARHKEGIDREAFGDAIVQCIAPAWAAEPALLDALFEHVNKSRSGVVSLSEWAALIETLGSLKGKLRLLYGMCGDKGDPRRTAAIVGLLCSCWRHDDDVSQDDLSSIANQTVPFSPEKFVRLLRKRFPELITSLELLSVEQITRSSQTTTTTPHPQSE